MGVRAAIRKFVLGNEEKFVSKSDLKIALLRGQLTLVAFLVGLVYPFLDNLSGVSGNEPYYLAVTVLALITFYLNRRRKFLLANLIFLTLINLLIFRFAATDPQGTGVQIFFVCASITALALFGYNNRLAGFAFILLSLVLCLISYHVDLPFEQRLTFTPEYTKFSFTVNFIISLITCGAIVYFLMDVNHHSEKQILEKNNELEKTNTELDRFVYSASHDLRAPLSSMRGLLDIVRRSNNPDEIKELVGRMEGRISNLDQLIADIIDYSRNNRQALQRREFHLHQLVLEVIEDLKYAVHAEKMSIECEIPKDLTITSDEGRIRVIVRNLISNAIKHHRKDSESRFVRIETSLQNETITISVIDNGPGIDSQHHELIFNMFYRASENRDGSGLGLYIVKETVGKLGGNIQMQSKAGEGCTFSVELPIDN